MSVTAALFRRPPDSQNTAGGGHTGGNAHINSLRSTLSNSTSSMAGFILRIRFASGIPSTCLYDVSDKKTWDTRNLVRGTRYKMAFLSDVGSATGSADPQFTPIYLDDAWNTRRNLKVSDSRMTLSIPPTSTATRCFFWRRGAWNWCPALADGLYGR